MTDYNRIGPGPQFDQASAGCDLMAMGGQSGFIAVGSTEFVAGAALGSAIGDAIRMNIIRERCMVLNGWKYKTKAEREREKQLAVKARQQAPVKPQSRKTVNK